MKTALIIVCMFAAHAQPTPDEFLGYKIGERFTPYSRILDYFDELARHSKLITVERFGLYRPDGSTRPVAADVATGFGAVTGPAASVIGARSRGSGVSAPAPEANHLTLYVAYALVVPVVSLIAIVYGLVWLRRRRLSLVRRFLRRRLWRRSRLRRRR